MKIERAQRAQTTDGRGDPTWLGGVGRRGVGEWAERENIFILIISFALRQSQMNPFKFNSTYTTHSLDVPYCTDVLILYMHVEWVILLVRGEKHLNATHSSLTQTNSKSRHQHCTNTFEILLYDDEEHVESSHTKEHRTTFNTPASSVEASDRHVHTSALALPPGIPLNPNDIPRSIYNCLHQRNTKLSWRDTQAPTTHPHFFR